ncbi:hypothetical protein MMC07_000321 [Pseudocyphellaria aurata]|nr:hypothetical protein [Pseudocyphellaria aurata]
MSVLEVSPLEEIRRPRYGRKWRKLPWSHWENIVKKPTVAELRDLCERYNQSFAMIFPATLIKQTMVEMAMHAVDLYKPPLDDEQVKKAFGFFASATDTAELSEQNPAFGNVTQAPPDRLLTPEQLQTIIRRYLQDVCRQSWRVAPDCVPYLPARPSHGGRTISSESSLQSRAGPVSWLKVAIRPSGSGRTKMEFSQSGKLFPCRGRGPIWHNNSCALDCAIVAARLLNLGRTVADRGPETHADSSSALPPLTRYFMDLIKLPWEDLDDKRSYAYRKKFLVMLLEQLNTSTGTNQKQIQIGEFVSVIAVWNASTLGMKQLSFSTHISSMCIKCGKRTTGSTSLNQCIYLDQIKDTLEEDIGKQPWSMSDILNRFFGTQRRRKPCAGCKSLDTRIFWRSVVGHLPQRLVVLPDQGYRDVRMATNNSIEFRYVDATNTSRVATYRWLGGIYKSGVHYRLYWTDHGEPNDARIDSTSENYNETMVYDGMELGGYIIGGVIPEVVPGDPEAKVPQLWSTGTDMLFYERVESSATALQSTADAIKLEAVRVVSELLQQSKPTQGVPMQPFPSVSPVPPDIQSVPSDSPVHVDSRQPISMQPVQPDRPQPVKQGTKRKASKNVDPPESPPRKRPTRTRNIPAKYPK